MSDKTETVTAGPFAPFIHPQDLSEAQRQIAALKAELSAAILDRDTALREARRLWDALAEAEQERDAARQVLAQLIDNKRSCGLGQFVVSEYVITAAIYALAASAPGQDKSP